MYQEIVVTFHLLQYSVWYNRVNQNFIVSKMKWRANGMKFHYELWPTLKRSIRLFSFIELFIYNKSSRSLKCTLCLSWYWKEFFIIHIWDKNCLNKNIATRCDFVEASDTSNHGWIFYVVACVTFRKRKRRHRLHTSIYNQIVLLFIIHNNFPIR